MFIHHTRQKAGFTLIEMAIVLGVVGILVAGLWRMVSAGNNQMRDQSAASQHLQLIAAVNNYLQSDKGQDLMKGTAASGSGATGTGAIDLPSAAWTDISTCKTNTTANPELCDYLPTGFYNATPNSYGQTYMIRFRKDTTAAGTRPQSYSFMILTKGGEAIADTSGGRISGTIGGDGGFIYSAAVCTAAASTVTACGSYGSWTAPAYDAGTAVNFGFAAADPAAGHIASRTFFSPLTGRSDLWLARSVYPGDTAFGYNTMSTNMYFSGADLNLSPSSGAGPGRNINMVGAAATGAAGSLNMVGGIINMNRSPSTSGGGNLNMQNGTIYMNNSTTTTGGGSLHMSGGTINLEGGAVVGSISGTASSLIQVSTDGTATSPLVDMSSSAAAHLDTLLHVKPSCSKDAVAGLGAADPSCKPGIDVFGDQNIAGRLNVNSLYALSLIYNGSDQRLKTDIKGLENPLNDVLRLRPVSFKYKSSGANSMGVIAQEIEKIYPQLVKENSDGMKLVNYEGLIAPLVGSVQALKKENDELRQKLDEQTKRQDRLEKLLEQHPH